jgi:hypothetical protein
MIRDMVLSDISTKSKEGKMLMAAMAILTTINQSHIDSGRFGSNITPQKAIDELVKLANSMYYAEEYNLWLKATKRNNLISDILDEKRPD